MAFLKLGAATAVTLLLAACGGGGSAEGPAPAPAPAAVPTPAPAPAPAPTPAPAPAPAPAPSPVAFTLTTTSFVPSGVIPVKHTCNGGETSPQLQWAIASDAVKSFALIMEDPDAVPLIGRPYVHWNVFQIPAAAREIAEGASRRAMPAGSVEGTNDDGFARYAGPCPPVGAGTHRYVFAVYALNVDSLTVDTTRPMRRDDFEKNHASVILQKVELQGSFGR